MTLTRRSWFQATIAALAGGTAVAQQARQERPHDTLAHTVHAMGPVGRVGTTTLESVRCPGTT